MPLKSVLFISQGDPGRGWEAQVSSPVAHVLISIYVYLICLTLALLKALWGYWTGLKWNPVSIADQLVLLHGSDILDDFNGLDIVDWKTMDSLEGQVNTDSKWYYW